eukprot:UN18413
MQQNKRSLVCLPSLWQRHVVRRLRLKYQSQSGTSIKPFT